MPDTESQTSQDLQDTAISWYVRARNPELSRADRRAFLQWMSTDARHREAFAAVEKLWGELAVPAQQLGASGWHRIRPQARRTLWSSAVAACLAMVLVAAVGWHNPGLLHRWQADFATLPGEQRQVQLADGSTVFLDGDSAIAFTLNTDERRLTLLRGRAWFDVVRDENKPFVTRHGDLEVRVLGTSFTVDTHGETRSVAVESGLVKVLWKNRPLSEQALGAGHQLRFVPGQPVQLLEQDVATLSAWRNGLFVFDRASLSDVVATMESALGQRLMISPSLRSLQITGVFQSSDPASMLEGLTRSAELNTRRIPGVGLYLSH